MNVAFQPPTHTGLLRIPTVFVLVLSAMLASTVGHAQRGDASRDGATDCRTLIEAARGARTVKEMDAIIRQRNPSQATMNQCGEPIVKDRTVASMIQQDTQRLEAAAQQREQQFLAPRRQMSAEQLPANQRLLRARQEGTARLNQLRGTPTTKKTTPARGLAPPPPAVSQVTPAPAVPGTDMVIEGNGLGDNGGSVHLKLQGKTFNAAINHWSDSWIGVYLPDDIGGVTESSAAVIEVRLANGQSLASPVGFVPLIVSDQLKDYFMGGFLNIYFWGQFTRTYFPVGGSLQNNWKIVDYQVLSGSTDSNCTVSGPPAMTKGGTALATRLLIGHGFADFGICQILVDVQGPQGFSHGAEQYRP